MPVETKLDIVGVVLVLAGLLTLISLFSAGSSSVLQAWHTLWSQGLGWGAVVTPFALVALGLWLVLRKSRDSVPPVAPQRALGVVLLVLASLAGLHAVASPSDDTLFAVARQGGGGGFVGALILRALVALVGRLGSLVTLTVWWLIAVTFALGSSVPEMIRQTGKLARMAQQGAKQLPLRMPRRASATPPALPPAPRLSSRRTVQPTPDDAADTSTVQAAPPITARGRATPESAAPAKVTGRPEDQLAAPATADGDDALPAGSPITTWALPQVAEILEHGTESAADDEFDRERAQLIEETLAAFGAPAKVVEVNRGPTITQFGVEPDYVDLRGGKRTKVKVGKIAALSNDLALALSAPSIRVEAPVPGKGYVGIEVPNTQVALVALRDVMESKVFAKTRSPLRIGLGEDVSGQAVVADLGAMPHLLIAGTTGSGKSVCVNAIIACLLLQNTPDALKLLMIDPKRVELTAYNGIPHLLAPVVVELDRVIASLQWVTREMDERYRRFAKAGARNLADFNARAAARGESPQPLLVVIIDELADLMMLAPDETERTIARLAQMARATGIHLVIATQRPSVDVVTGLIKANFPARISFAVASSVDSRVVLDQSGAEKLLGRGDMLFQSPDAPAAVRMQGAFVSDAETQRLVRYWREAALPAETDDSPEVDPVAKAETPDADYRPVAHQPPLWEEMQKAMDGNGQEDELLADAIQAVREMRKASISLLQRRLRIGYTRSARLMDLLEEKGIVGPAQSGAQAREVLDYGE